MSRSLFNKKRERRKPKIEIIPMVDVMFLLLVFYILGSIGLTVERGIPVSLPQAVTGVAQVVEETKVTITKSGAVFLNHDRIELGELGQKVKEHAEKHPGGLKHLQEGYLVLNIDLSVTQRTVVQAMDQLRSVGITNYSFAIEDEG